MKEYRVAAIPGDGIGLEVVPTGMTVLSAAAEVCDFQLKFAEFNWGYEYYLRNSRMMDRDGLEKLVDFDAIYFGTVGWPAVPDHVSLWGLLIPIRQGFDQYVNLRPVRLLKGVKGPLRDRTPQDINMVFVRENSEGEYCGIGGRARSGTPYEVVQQTTVFTRNGVERILRYAFELAQSRQKILASATKSNALQYTMVFWDDLAKEMAREFPQVELTHHRVDDLAAELITHPESFDVIVCPNLFGDILTDIGGALQGSMGIPASANLNPERRYPSMFQPVHGSVPAMAGRNEANPIAAIWAGSMLLEFIGEKEAGQLVMQALEKVVARGKVRTPDLGGNSTTTQVAQAVVKALQES